MSLSVETAALLVRVTARVSAASFAISLGASASRLGAGAAALAARRRSDLAAFGLFIAAHTVHFASVALLAWVTEGRNIRDAGGYAATGAAGLAFYAACGAVLRSKARRAARWSATGQRRLEVSTSAIIWIIFFQAYALRLTQSALFAALALALAAALALFLARARTPISSNMHRPSVGGS
jgi:hypothetical protein